MLALALFAYQVLVLGGETRWSYGTIYVQRGTLASLGALWYPRSVVVCCESDYPESAPLSSRIFAANNSRCSAYIVSYTYDSSLVATGYEACLLLTGEHD